MQLCAPHQAALHTAGSALLRQLLTRLQLMLSKFNFFTATTSIRGLHMARCTYIKGSSP